MPLLAIAGVAVALLVLALVALVLRARAREEERLDALLVPAVDGSPIVKLAQRIVEDAYARGASAVHIEPAAESARVRYRIDGELEERMRLPRAALPALLARYSVMAGLSPGDDRVQQGRIELRPDRLEVRGLQLDLDLGVVRWRTVEGPGCVLRLLPRGTLALGLDGLGLTAANLERVRAALRGPKGGVVLFAGDAASGRTTLMHAAREELGQDRAVVVAGPDEHLPWVAGVEPATVPHLDADVLVAGELRDEATARLAFEAAQHGTVVLATIFAADVGMAIARLADDLRVSRHVLGLCLRLVAAQRLVRRLCRTCKRAEGGAFVPGQDPACPLCEGRGFKGRVALQEVVPVEGALHAAIARGEASAAALQRAALEAGMTPLREDGLAKVRLGDTSRAEVEAAG